MVVPRGPGEGDELVEADAALTGLDAAQRGRAHVTPSGKRVQAPPPRLPQAADALTDYVGHIAFRHERDARAGSCQNRMTPCGKRVAHTDQGSSPQGGRDFDAQSELCLCARFRGALGRPKIMDRICVLFLV